MWVILHRTDADWDVVGDTISFVCSKFVERSAPDWQKFSEWLGRLLPRPVEGGAEPPPSIKQARAALRTKWLKGSASFEPLPAPSGDALSKINVSLRAAAQQWQQRRLLGSSGDAGANVYVDANKTLAASKQRAMKQARRAGGEGGEQGGGLGDEQQGTVKRTSRREQPSKQPTLKGKLQLVDFTIDIPEVRAP